MAEFGLIRPFGIDDGELDGLTPQEIFTLGYELAMVDEALKLPGAISRMIHAENKDRIEAEAIKSGRPYKLFWAPGDRSETWMQLEVAPAGGN
jgi:hypothetical protein